MRTIIKKMLAMCVLMVSSASASASPADKEAIINRINNMLNTRVEIITCNLFPEHMYLGQKYHQENFTPEFGALNGWAKTCSFPPFVLLPPDPRTFYRSFDVLTGVYLSVDPIGFTVAELLYKPKLSIKSLSDTQATVKLSRIKATVPTYSLIYLKKINGVWYVDDAFIRGYSMELEVQEIHTNSVKADLIEAFNEHSDNKKHNRRWKHPGIIQFEGYRRPQR